MKRWLFAGTAIFACSGPLAAADISEPLAAYDWSGPYIGVHAGYLWGDADVEEEGVAIGGGGGDVDGFVGGLVGGWNYQADSIVLGIEGDFGFTDADGKGVVAPPSVDFYEYDMDWNAHLRLRAGVAADRTLIFIAGGLAVTEFHLGYEAATPGGTYYGWTVGGGIEHAFTENLIMGIEGLYDDYGGKSYDFDDEEAKADLEAVTARATLKLAF